ncbi:MAG: magnesium transporter CorA family protein [Acidobacteria bacterium]|nr:magnesium transporter CorA family protein [Acidobacteriota bacterium]
MSDDEEYPLPVPAPESAPGDPQTAGTTAASVTEATPPRCPTRTRWYRAGRVAEEGFPAEGISERLEEDEHSFVWLDLFDPQIADLAIVTQEFGLHPLAVEDAVQDHQRPKLDRYQTHLFANMYALALRSELQGAQPAEGEDDDLIVSEISAFITNRALITVRKSDYDVDALLHRWDASAHLTKGGVGFLVHGLLDSVVDGQYRTVEQIADRIDVLEEEVFDSGDRSDVRRRGFALRRELSRVGRVVGPMHEVVGRLLRGSDDRALVTPEMEPYYQDVLDHVVSAVGDLDAARDQVSSVLETNLNEQGNDLNIITRKLASWAAIIAVPTAVTGFYGQNVPYPGFSKEWGFATSTTVIVGLAGGLFLALRRRGWL